MIYQALAAGVPLSQGDILDGCPLFGLETSSADVNLNAAPARWETRVIVITQACDLAQSRTTKVVVALVHMADELVRAGFSRDR